MRKPLRILTYVIAFGVGACDGDSVNEPVSELPQATRSRIRSAPLFGAGHTVKDVAASMNLSAKTVSTYRSRLLVKLHASSNADLVQYVASHGLIS